MSPIVPPVHNRVYTAPPELDRSQVFSIHAYHGVVPPGYNLDGAEFVVTAWKPSPEDLQRLNEGGVVFLSQLGGLSPHHISTEFSAATYGLEG